MSYSLFCRHRGPLTSARCHEVANRPPFDALRDDQNTTAIFHAARVMLCIMGDY
jgi:hypothetical protein